MTNSVYQQTVQALEAVLSPRVVSRSLQEGLKQVDKDPASVTHSDIEKILKAQIYRQLQVTMPVTAAKDKIKEILDSIKELPEPRNSSASLQTNVADTQKQAVEDLQAALKPFNLYFEWPETQKFRAQLQLLESELEAGRDVSKLLSGARQQLQTLEQKLEDLLVIQARELGELDGAFEQVKSLGGPKVRRLENLIGQIRSAQGARQLASAEVDRVRKLVTDLRKLMESSVVVEEPAKVLSVEASTEEGGLLDVELDEDMLLIDTDALPAEVSAKLLMLDLENERHKLEALEAEYANLLAYRPDLAQQFQTHKGTLQGNVSLGDTLLNLRPLLTEAQDALRQELTRELTALRGGLAHITEEYSPEQALPGSEELEYALAVTLGVLGTTLPSLADVQGVRSQYALIEQHHAARLETLATAKVSLEQQANALAQFQAGLQRYEPLRQRPEYDAFLVALGRLAQAQADAQVFPEGVSAARQAQEQLEARIVQEVLDGRDRERAQVQSLLNQLQALPVLASYGQRIDTVREELVRQLAEVETHALGEAQIKGVAALVSNLKANLKNAYEQQLAKLAERATPLADQGLLGRIQQGLIALESGEYPDLEALERALNSSSERRRTEQLAELLQLEGEGQAYRGLDLAEARDLERFLKEARSRLESGRVVDSLDRGWLLLDGLRSALAERLSSFEQRLDAAMQAFEPVSRLNNEETATVGRTLNHLNTQRAAFYRVSPGIQSQLVASLAEAEALIGSLQEQYEATRAIAGQLVSHNVLDDILGIFGGDMFAEAPAPPAQAAELVEPVVEAPAPATRVHAGGAPLHAWMNGYLNERGVSGTVVISTEGQILGGSPQLMTDGLSKAIRIFEGDISGLSQELGLGSAQLVTIEMPGKIAVLAWVPSGPRIVVLLDNPAMLSLVLTKLRRDLPTLGDVLRGPAFA
jgi:chromosome segregation protein